MSVTVASCTLAEIFDAHSNNKVIAASNEDGILGKLTLPEYQRPYCWGEVQIKRLLSDYEEYLSDLASKKTSYGYYLGSIILHKSAENGCLNIIDGQQRLTTLALIFHVRSVINSRSFDFSLSYDSPESQQHIMRNLRWLSDNMSQQIEAFDPDTINLTLVVTDSEDDAYRFFETQNTGGVRLSGPDIIKAHHLRAVDPTDRNVQNEFARKWEALGKLDSIVASLIKGRYWRKINTREVPSHRVPTQVRGAIVSELGESTGTGADIAYGRFKRTYLSNGCQIDEQAQQGYAMRQPLNSGANTIHYIRYFEGLRSKYLAPFDEKTECVSELSSFDHFYKKLVCGLEGCSFLKGLYDTSLLLYISQFGEDRLNVAARKLFRVIYTPRVSNRKAVREDSISAFIRKKPVLDWITISYTPEECFEHLDSFDFQVDLANLDPDKRSVKKRFMTKVISYLSHEKQVDDKLSPQELADKYKATLDNKVVSMGKNTLKGVAVYD